MAYAFNPHEASDDTKVLVIAASVLMGGFLLFVAAISWNVGSKYWHLRLFGVEASARPVAIESLAPGGPDRPEQHVRSRWGPRASLRWVRIEWAGVKGDSLGGGFAVAAGSPIERDIKTMIDRQRTPVLEIVYLPSDPRVVVPVAVLPDLRTDGQMLLGMAAGIIGCLVAASLAVRSLLAAGGARG